MNLVLASASQRREELLKRITEDFEIVVSNFDEGMIHVTNNYPDYVMNIAKGKACNVAKDIINQSIIVGFDTVVVFEDKILGKPKDKEDAFRMLKMLSGSIHKVYSGIAIICTEDNKVVTDYACTEVTFSQLTDDEILQYIATGEPMDKAGAYGIQGYGGVFVERINGCYYNVVGLPLNKLNFMLKGIGVFL